MNLSKYSILTLCFLVSCKLPEPEAKSVYISMTLPEYPQVESLSSVSYLAVPAAPLPAKKRNSATVTIYESYPVYKTVVKEASSKQAAPVLSKTPLDSILINSFPNPCYVGVPFTVTITVTEFNSTGEPVVVIDRAPTYSIIVEGNPIKDFEIHPSSSTRETQRRPPLGSATTWTYQVKPLRFGDNQPLLVVVRSYGQEDQIGTEVKTISLKVNVKQNAKSYAFYFRNGISHPFTTNVVSGLAGVLFTFLFMRKKDAVAKSKKR